MAKKPKKEAGNRPFAGLKKLAKDRKEAARAVAAKHMVDKRKPKPAPPKAAPPKATAPKATPSKAAHAKGSAESTVDDAPAEYSYEDRVAFSQAFAGVRPIDAPPPKKKQKAKKAKPAKSRRAAVEAERAAAEEAARTRLDQLVGGGAKFKVTRTDGVEGRRSDASDRTVRMLRDGKLPPELTLDLHGLTKAEAGPKIRAFVRDAHKRGRRTLALVHGKGTHSEGGVGVLRDVVIEALSQGGAAPLVDSFATAPSRFGGEGAILVRLR